MATPAQIDANRKNAQKSTGPKTPAGKLIASQNAAAHGLTANHVIIDNENRAEFNSLCARRGKLKVPGTFFRRIGYKLHRGANKGVRNLFRLTL